VDFAIIVVHLLLFVEPIEQKLASVVAVVLEVIVESKLKYYHPGQHHLVEIC